MNEINRLKSERSATITSPKRCREIITALNRIPNTTARIINDTESMDNGSEISVLFRFSTNRSPVIHQIKPDNKKWQVILSDTMYKKGNTIKKTSNLSDGLDFVLSEAVKFADGNLHAPNRMKSSEKWQVIKSNEKLWLFKKKKDVFVLPYCNNNQSEPSLNIKLKAPFLIDKQGKLIKHTPAQKAPAKFRPFLTATKL